MTKGPGSRAAGLAMAFKLIEAAQARWRAVNGPHLVALARRAGQPWSAVGAVLGTTRQAAQQRFDEPAAVADRLTSDQLAYPPFNKPSRRR